jgi:hypothetical protein
VTPLLTESTNRSLAASEAGELAGPEQGMVGNTACALGRAPGDEQALYLTTDGIFLIPHESGIQDAKLVRMDVGESSWPLLQGV